MKKNSLTNTLVSMLPPSEDETLSTRKLLLSKATTGKEKSVYLSPEPKPTYDLAQGNKGLISLIETNKQTSYSTLTSLTQERAHASSTKGRGLS